MVLIDARPGVQGAQGPDPHVVHGMVTLQREGTSPISLSAWQNEQGVHFIAPGQGAREILLTEGMLFEFTPAASK